MAEFAHIKTGSYRVPYTRKERLSEAPYARTLKSSVRKRYGFNNFRVETPRSKWSYFWTATKSGYRIKVGKLDGYNAYSGILKYRNKDIAFIQTRTLKETLEALDALIKTKPRRRIVG